MKLILYIFALLGLTFISSCIHSQKNNEIDYTYNQSKTLGVKLIQTSPFDIEFVQFNNSNEIHYFIPYSNELLILDENKKLIIQGWARPDYEDPGVEPGESRRLAMDVYQKLWYFPEGIYYVYYDDPHYKVETNTIKIRFKKEKYLRPYQFSEPILNVTSRALNDSIYELTITNMHKYAIPLDSVYAELSNLQSDGQEQNIFGLTLRASGNNLLPKIMKSGKPVVVQINLAKDLKDKVYPRKVDIWEFYLVNKAENRAYDIDYDYKTFYPDMRYKKLLEGKN